MSFWTPSLEVLNPVKAVQEMLGIETANKLKIGDTVKVVSKTSKHYGMYGKVRKLLNSSSKKSMVEVYVFDADKRIKIYENSLMRVNTQL